MSGPLKCRVGSTHWTLVGNTVIKTYLERFSVTTPEINCILFFFIYYGHCVFLHDIKAFFKRFLLKEHFLCNWESSCLTLYIMQEHNPKNTFAQLNQKIYN